MYSETCSEVQSLVKQNVRVPSRRVQDLGRYLDDPEPFTAVQSDCHSQGPSSASSCNSIPVVHDATAAGHLAAVLEGLGNQGYAPQDGPLFVVSVGCSRRLLPLSTHQRAVVAMGVERLVVS